jgi:putative oxidoreductase
MVMKRLFQTGIKEEYLNLILLVLRISLAVLMIRHGFPKLTKLLEGGEIQFGNPIGLGPGISLGLAVFAEFFCSILVGIGLGTRLASIPLMITMGVAAFISHGADPFERKELAIMYLLFYLVLLVMGSGKYSIDYFLTRKNR